MASGETALVIDAHKSTVDACLHLTPAAVRQATLCAAYTFIDTRSILP